MFGTIIIVALIFLSSLIIYFGFYEKWGIYYPSKSITYTPKDIGLHYQDVFFKTSDDVVLNAWFIPAENRLTVLFLHGNAGNLSNRVEIINLLNNLKVNVFIVDWRGYGKSKGTPHEQGLYQDALGAYNYLVKEKNIRPDSIVVYGKSLGAVVAVDLASKVEVKGLIFDSGFTCARDLVRRFYPYFPAQYFLKVKYDSLAKISKISCPKLIIHSEDDEIIPFKLGKRIFEAATLPKQFMQLKGGHNEAIFFDVDKFSSQLEAFLKSL